MRIASYNIRKAVGLDWRRDPDRIVDVLAEIDADVVVLQEADRRIGARAGVLPLDHNIRVIITRIVSLRTLPKKEAKNRTTNSIIRITPTTPPTAINPSSPFVCPA